jgi:hypothetical protein
MIDRQKKFEGELKALSAFGDTPYCETFCFKPSYEEDLGAGQLV